MVQGVDLIRRCLTPSSLTKERDEVVRRDPLARPCPLDSCELAAETESRASKGAPWPELRLALRWALMGFGTRRRRRLVGWHASGQSVLSSLGEGSARSGGAGAGRHTASPRRGEKSKAQTPGRALHDTRTRAAHPRRTREHRRPLTHTERGETRSTTPSAQCTHTYHVSVALCVLCCPCARSPHRLQGPRGAYHR